MMRTAKRWLFPASALAALAAATGASARDWLEYRNEKFDFSLRVPADHFRAGTPRNPEVGGLWISRDGQARLIAVATPNDTGGSLDAYRSFLIEQSYADARLDYTPRRDNWFVLSGVKGDQIFYERVTFVCEGRYIYGWQLIYPSRQKRRYDPIVEGIHKSYRIGKGEGESCD